MFINCRGSGDFQSLLYVKHDPTRIDLSRDSTISLHKSRRVGVTSDLLQKEKAESCSFWSFMTYFTSITDSKVS